MKSNVKFLVTLLAFLATNFIFAQGIPDDPDIQQVPVDGGIFTVVGSAITYGVYRLRNKNNK
jgi:hypothetical protein